MFSEVLPCRCPGTSLIVKGQRFSAMEGNWKHSTGDQKYQYKFEGGNGGNKKIKTGEKKKEKKKERKKKRKKERKKEGNKS